MDEPNWLELRELRVVLYGGDSMYWAGPFLSQDNAEKAALTILSGNSKQSVVVYNLQEIKDIVEDEIGDPSPRRLKLYEFLLDTLTEDSYE